jgi:mRNA-degrading endonuclease RelE of RelBE toxin-antitoxin system
VSYRINISTIAHKEIKALPGYVRAQALQVIRALADTPIPSRAKELRGKPNIYRLWLAGRWRIAYHLDDDRLLVLILRVRAKEDMDYDSLKSP